MLHYGILWNLSGTGYAFDKHWHYDFDALACPPWDMRCVLQSHVECVWFS